VQVIISPTNGTDELARVLQKWIRARGGDVQLALGQRSR
jgi:hypothetical protein